jgi:hypothetical protein
MREARRENYGAGENSPAFCFAEIRRPEHDIDWSFQAKFVLLSNFNQPFSVLPGHGLLRECAQDCGRRRSLIAECAYRPGRAVESWPHLNPETAARIAVESHAKLLYLVHFDASLYPTLNDRLLAEETARSIFPRTVASIDGIQVQV